MTPFDLILHFFRVRTHSIRLRAKFEVSSFNHSRGIRGFKNSKSGSRDHHMNPFDLNLHFLLELTAVRLCAIFEVFSFNRSRDIRGSQNYKSGSRDPHMTPFNLILHFFH